MSFNYEQSELPEQLGEDDRFFQSDQNIPLQQDMGEQIKRQELNTNLPISEYPTKRDLTANAGDTTPPPVSQMEPVPKVAYPEPSQVPTIPEVAQQSEFDREAGDDLTQQRNI